MLLVAILALAVPSSFSWIATRAINPMLGAIMFGMGLTLAPQDFKIVLSRPKDILIGCAAFRRLSVSHYPRCRLQRMA